MNQSQALASALNSALAKQPGFNNAKARAIARRDEHSVDAVATKAANPDFNPEVDEFETFVMADGSACRWQSGSRKFIGK